MKTIIAGPRDVPHEKAILLVQKALAASNWLEEITEVIHGAAAGIDTAAGLVASEIPLPVTAIHAQWQKHGKAAGPIRNRQMAEMADALIAIAPKSGITRGTANMIKTAKELGLRVFVFEFDV